MGKETNRSEAIRQVKTKHPEMTAPEIVTALAKEKIVVTPSLVYNVVGRMQPAETTPAETTPAKPRATPSPRATAAASSTTGDSFQAIAGLTKKLGKKAMHDLINVLPE